MRGTAPRSGSLGLGQQRWPKVTSHEALLLVPVGSVEQHGPHLPLATDAMVANAVTRAAAERLDATGIEVLVAPSLNYGASGEHEGFPGTISIGHEALFLLLAELGRSARPLGPRGDLRQRPRRQHRDDDQGGGRCCATRAGPSPGPRPRCRTRTRTPGETETSLLRHLAPWAVRVDLMAPGATEPVAELMPRLRDRGRARRSPRTACSATPPTSSAERGRELFERLVATLVAELVALDVGRERPAVAADPRRGHARATP